MVAERTGTSSVLAQPRRLELLILDRSDRSDFVRRERVHGRPLEIENEPQAVGDGCEPFARQGTQALHEIGAKHLLHVVDVRD